MRISDWSSDVCSSDLYAGWPDLRGYGAVALHAINASTMAATPVRTESTQGNPCGSCVRAIRSDAASSSKDVVLRLIPTIRASGLRSEERRVGKEGVSTGRYRWSPEDSQQNTEDIKSEYRRKYTVV